mgnify:CR=1 FL=1
MRHFTGALSLALALGLAPLTAQAQGGPLAACADPGTKPPTALEVCRDALRDPRLTPGQRAGVLVNLGVAQAALDRHGDAARSFGLAIRTDPDLVQAYTNRARSLIALGRAEEAMADFDAAVELAPRRADSWLGRGGLHLRMGEAGKAVEDLSRAIGLDPRGTAAFYNRGLANMQLGRPREAATDFSVVVARAPEDVDALVARAEARAAAGIEGARADFDRALELAPDRGESWLARGRFLDARGEAEAANRDFLRAYELGVEDRWLVERVQGLGPG